MPNAILAKNLSQLRHERGWSQEEIAKKIGLSRVGYSNIELGKSEPRGDTLYDLAEAFEVPIEELLREKAQLKHVRFRSDARLKSRDQALAKISRWIQGYEEIEEILGEPSHCKLPQKKFGTGRESAIRAAEQIRLDLDIKAEEPIRNIAGVLEERAGIKLLLMPIATDGFFGLSVSKDDGGPAIVVNSWDRISVERWIFSAIHELGHLVLHLNAYDVHKENEEAEQEKEADVFAAHFLMPPQQFDKEWDNSSGLSLYDRVLHVKRVFNVSYRTVLMRLNERVPKIWIRFLAEHKRRNNRVLPRTEEVQALGKDAFCSVYVADEPQHLVQADLIETRLKRLVRRALDEDKISLTKAAELLNLNLLAMRELANMWVA